MKVTFTYDKEKDIWCLLSYGKSSMNSQEATKTYKELITKYGENPTDEMVSLFIQETLSKNNLYIPETISNYQKEWDAVAKEYIQRAEYIFDVKLPHDVTAYITINNRCPYSINDNMFFVSLPTYSAKKTTMHELWHFYTWYAFGITEEGRIGKIKYNEIKEALTVLLNVECRDLLPEGTTDIGYSQHQELRQKIVSMWEKEKNMKKIWETLSNE